MNHNYAYKTVISLTGKDTVAEFMFLTAPLQTITTARALLFSNEDFTAQIWENVTTSSDGTQIVTGAFNLDRAVGNGNLMRLYAAPTVTNYGMLIWETRLWPGVWTGVSQWSNYEIVAAPNTRYVWRLVKNSSGTHFVDINFWWSEHLKESV